MVYAGEWYNGQKEPMTVYTGNKLSILLGMPRLRQLRIKKGMQSDEVAFRNVFHSILLFYIASFFSTQIHIVARRYTRIMNSLSYELSAEMDMKSLNCKS